ncbi:MAG: tetratricopeptide repeat protein [Chloroflexi bacterium]|nr:tetratricopeptide repeat protein [Chloroflexota bacterium]
METNLLQTKLYIPTLRPSLVPRPHLVAKLAAKRPLKLILVSAPAGYGKTTLVTEWIHQKKDEGRTMKDETASEDIHPSQIAWLSLNEDDSDPQQFFSYLAAAIRPLTNDQSSLPQLLQSPQPPPAKKMMAAFVNDVVPVSIPFYLILDDYHTIESVEIDRAMAFLLDHMPPHMTLVITSRTDPGFPISRLRVRGQLTEIRADDLRFTEAEATQFLHESMNLTLSPEQIAALETRTEGWIAGLQMAALSMQGRADTANFITAFTGSHRFVLDYLLEEVMQSQPEPIRNFLLQTSIFDRLSGPLCNAITGQKDSRAMLEHLERGNMFVVPLDDARQQYRYHHLFADVLQARLLDEQSAHIPTLHRRASAWYEQNGFLPDAIHHALAAKDFERAAGLIELIWPTMDMNFQSNAWLRWAELLPDDLVYARPVLSVAYAWAFLNGGEVEAAKSRLQDAERAYPEPVEGQSKGIVVVDEDQFRFLPASIASAYCYAALAVGDIANTVTYARQALDLLPENDYLRRGPAASLLGLAYWANGELEAAHRALAEAMAGFQKNGNIAFAISGTYGLADLRIGQGRLREAVRIYERSLQLATAQGDPPIPGTADLYLGLGMLAHERGDAEDAKQHLAKNEELGEQAALADWPYRWCIAQAKIKQTQGDMDDTLALLDEAERLYFNTPVPNARPVPALKAQIWIAQGRLADAQGWAKESGLSIDGDLSYLREFEFMTLARIRIAQHKGGQADNAIHDAMQLIERLLKAAETRERTGSVIEILLLQALAYEAQNDISSAVVPLKRALTLAEPEGYVRIFTDEGLPMAKLLQKVASTNQNMKEYIHKLLATFDLQEKIPSSSFNQLVDPLSKRELQILALIADGLKNKEIAEQLIISLNTVLYHIKNIYSKLGVNRRPLAIAKAKELNLI